MDFKPRFSFVVVLALFISSFPLVTSAAAEPTVERPGPERAAIDDSAVEVTPIVDRDYQSALEGILASAARSVDIIEFEFLSESGTVRQISGRLAEMKKANPALRVRVFLEGDKSGLGDRNRKTKSFLDRNGVDARIDARGCTTHAKVVAVDDDLLLIGSTNLSNTSLHANNEANVLIRSKALAKGFNAYFERLLAEPASPAPWNTLGFG